MSRLSIVTAALLLAAASCGRAPRPAGVVENVEVAPVPPVPTLAIDPAEIDGPLTVVAARPHGEIADPGSFHDLPTITFSKPMVPLGGVDASLPAPARIHPEVPGAWRWLGSSSVEFVPASRLPHGTEFTVTVPAGLAALDGSRLDEPFVFTFATSPPRVEEVEPAPGHRWLPERPTFTVTFHAPVADLAGATHLVVGDRVVRLRVTGEEDVLAARRARGEPIPPWEQHRTSRRYTLEPVEPLPSGTDVTLVFEAGLRSPEGPRGLPSDVAYGFATHGPPRVVEARACAFAGPDGCPYGPLVLLATNPLDPATLREHVVVSPGVGIDWDGVSVDVPDAWSPVPHPWATLPGRLAPGTTYTVEIRDGVLDAFGQPVPPTRLTLTTPHLPPVLHAGGPALLEADGPGVLPLQGANLERIEAEVWPVTAAELARLAATSSVAVPAGPPRRITVPTPVRDEVRAWPLDVRAALDGARTGLFVARVRGVGVAGDHRPVIRGQLTDLAVHAKLGPASSLAWVTSLATGAPVPSATVRLYDAGGVERWSGVTDADGLVQLPGLVDAFRLAPDHTAWNGPFALVAAEKGGDVGVTLSTWSGELSPWAFGVWGDWEGPRPEARGTLFTERGIYRPGDAVRAKGLVRTSRVGRLETPPENTPVTLTLTDPRGETVWTGRTTTSDFGTFHAEVPLPADAPLGWFGLQAEATVLGQPVGWYTGFRVEEFVAPPFTVDVVAEAGAAVAGEPVHAQVAARYLFGAGMADAPVRWTVYRHAVEPSFPDAGGFTVGQGGWWDDGEEAPWRHEGIVASGETRADRTGAAHLDVGGAEAPLQRPWELVIEAEAEDVGRTRAAGRTRVRVHPADAYAGLRVAGSGFARAGQPVTVELVALDTEGKRRAGVALQLDVMRRTWTSIRKRGASGALETVTDVVDEDVASCTRRSAAEPVACTFTPERPGYYRLTATATDARGRTQVSGSAVYVTGDGWVAWDRDDTDRIELVLDRPSYRAGDVARVLVKSPWPEAEAVLTVEREGVLTARRVRLTGVATPLEVPITEDLAPDAYVGVVLVRGRVPEADGGEAGLDPGRPAFRAGYARLEVDTSRRRLDVAVRPAVTEARPGDDVRIDLAVTDIEGRPVAAEVAVWAVDEAVLRLTAYEPPDPVAALHPSRGLSTRIAEPLLHLVRLLDPEALLQKGVDGGGGGGDAFGDLRSQFATTPLWAPQVRTGADGRASVVLPLPDDLTTFRVLAVAIDREHRAGAGRADVTASKPLLALPSLPRLLRVGDRGEVGVVVHTPGFRGREVTVTARVQGLRLDGPATRTVTVVPGSAVEVLFPVVAEAPGTATVAFAAEGRGERDAFEKQLPVALPVATEAVAVHGDTRDVATEALLLPGEVRPDVGGLEITLASTVLGGLGEGIDQLVDYPFGCAEQLASRLVPLLALRELHHAFDLPWDDAADGPVSARALAAAGVATPDELVRTTIHRLEALQGPEGGYRYWPGDACPSPWASAWTYAALVRAREAGFEVRADGLARAEAFLAAVLTGEVPGCVDAFWQVDDATRVFTAWALARAGTPRASWHADLDRARHRLPRYARALLADTLAVSGERELAKARLSEVLDRAEESAAGLHVPDDAPDAWSSDARTTAIVLRTLLALNPEHPYVGKLSRWLLDARRADGRWRSTQEAAFALLAFADVVRLRETERPAFEATVTLGDTVLASRRFEGRSLDVARATVPMDALPASSSPLPLAFAKEGTGLLHYGALLRYAPVRLPTTPLDRGITLQRWVEPWEGGGQVRAARTGELVRVRVRVATPKRRTLVAVSVPLPAGLEVVDTSLATTARLPEIPPDAGYGWDEAWWWSPFVHVERRDGRIDLFADDLPAGVHETTLVARAVTPGEWVFPPAHAEEMYAPEVFGRSDGGLFRVLLGPSEVAER